MLGWIKAALLLGINLFGWLKGGKKTLADALPFAIGQLLPAVENAVKFQKLDTKEKLDAWLEAVDAGTGDDATGVDIIRGLPAAKEEELFDHLIEVARTYGYYLIGVPGYRE